ncbi:MAG: hypothetical protein ACRDFS_05095 [Chloroflexota bacterium]
MDVSKPVVVLAGSGVGHGIARSLGRLGVPVIGVHDDMRSPVARSRFWIQSHCWDFRARAEPESVEWLVRLGERVGGQPLLIPTDDRGALFVSSNARMLCDTFLFPAQPPDLADRLSNKRTMYRLCQEHDVPTASTVFPENRGQVEEFSRHAGFPVMLKGIDTAALKRRTGVAMVLAGDPESLLTQYDALETPGRPSVMLQEYVPGDSQDIWMFNGYFNDDSRCLFGGTGRKLREFPSQGGVTSLGVCQANDTVSRRTERFMKDVGYRGILDIGFKYDRRDGRYKLLDVNPRIGATFRLFVDSSGTDVARAMYLDLTGQQVPAGVMSDGRKWLMEPFDVVSSLHHMRTSNLGVGAWVRSLRGVRECCWFAADDMKPFWRMASASIRRGGDRKRRKRSSVGISRDGAARFRAREGEVQA